MDRIERGRAVTETGSPRRGPARSRPRVLVLAYACEPDRGSEPGAGWGLVQALASFADCVVLVGPEHARYIRRWEGSHPSLRLRFVEVAEPGWGRIARWHRIARFLLYLGWLRRADRVGRELCARHSFDAVCHATYSTYWLPTPATRFGPPCVWGPVGGAVRTPVRLWPVLGWKGIAEELLDLVGVRLASFWPSTRRTWRGVAVGLVQNPETLQRLPAPLRDRCQVLNHAMFVEPLRIEARPRKAHLLHLSPLERRKGAALTLRALAYAPKDVELWLVGGGPERNRLERLAHRLGVSNRVRFLGNVSRQEVFELLAEAAGAIFSGLREEGGLALAEAMVSGVPVIVLAHGGARTLADAATDPSRIELVLPAGVDETARRLAAAMTRIQERTPGGSRPLLDQPAARRVLQQAFVQAVSMGRPGGTPDRVAPLEGDGEAPASSRIGCAS